MGGTFPATPLEYQTWFIQRCLDAITGKTSANLEAAKANAEVSQTRNVGITVETRPTGLNNLISMVCSTCVTRRVGCPES